MSRRKNDVFAQAVVGLFMVVVVALLAYFTIVISGVDILAGRNRTRMTVRFEQVGGLKDHDNVMYRGTKVGVVEHVAVTPTNLLVIANIDGQVTLREGYRITVCNLSMLGGNYLTLEEGAGHKLDLEKTVFRGESPTDWMQDVSKIARNMNDLMGRRELREIVSNVCAATERARVIADKAEIIVSRIERGEGTVGRLLSANNKLYDGLEQTVDNAREISGRIRRGEGMVGKLLAQNNKLYEDLESTVGNVRELTDRVKRGEGMVGKLLADDEKLYVDLRESVAAFRKACESFDLGDARSDVKGFVEKGSRLMDNLNAVAENLRNGKGTLGRLAAEDGMYNEVEGLIRDCRQIIDNYRDSTPISTFSSLATGAL